MTLLSRLRVPHRYAAFLRQFCGYVAAIVLPWLSTVLTMRVHALHGTPLALSFVSVAAITLLCGLSPGILAVVFTAFIFNHLVLAPPHWLAFDLQSLIYTALILAVGFVIALLCERQRVTGSRLRAALTSLQVRTDSLTEAQQASNAAAWMYSIDDGQLQWAVGGARVFGRPFSDDDALQDALNPIVDDDRDRVLQEFSAAIAANQHFRSEFRVRWPSGEIRWLESRGKPSLANEKIWHGVTLDITDRKNAEFALVRSEKLAAVGRLSATIAHEVNNPLESVTNLLYLALSEPLLPPEARTYLQRADQELARLASIARRTLTFVRSKSSSGPVNVREVVDSVIAMFQPRCTARAAQIRVRCNAELTLPLPADDLRQILTNIVSNACDALPLSGGIIEIEIVRHDKTASISVRDNGSGISPKNLPRVFDPFFTTKDEVGTGIGLWVTKDLVDKNGGRISVQTSFLPPGFLTMFRVEFPLA
ncbi:MAG: ATP-binding protein [Acidobacteriaceae bacterium]